MPPPLLVVMGVSGSGKSTVAAALARRLGVPTPTCRRRCSTRSSILEPLGPHEAGVGIDVDGSVEEIVEEYVDRVAGAGEGCHHPRMAYFDVAADAYLKFMGRFSVHLSPQLADIGLAGVDPAARVLDVGCGPGVLTDELVRRCGADRVAAVDPVPAFVEAAAATHPGADVRTASAEDLPFADGAFGATLAQLVVHFLKDPVVGVREMARVTAPRGRVSACVWDHGGGAGPLSTYWRTVLRTDPDAQDEGYLPGTHHGDLTRIFRDAGLREVVEDRITVTVRFATFEEWWEPFTYGVGPAGQYVAGLDDAHRERLVTALREELGDGPFQIEAAAWVATGRV